MPKGLNRLRFPDPVAGSLFEVVLPGLACLGRIQFPIRDQLRLPGIIDGGSRRGVGGDQISRDRAHDLVIDTNLPTIVGIVLGMVLAMVGDKRPVIQRVAGDLGRLAQKDCPGGTIPASPSIIATIHRPRPRPARKKRNMPLRLLGFNDVDTFRTAIQPKTRPEKFFRGDLLLLLLLTFDFPSL